MEKTNMQMAIEALEEELEGFDDYMRMAEITTCPELKKIFLAAGAEEKTHAAALLTWVNAAAGKVLK